MVLTPRINFSLTQLEYVMAVRRFGHFAKAAEACHVTQPTLSMQLQKLEEDLGIVLFDRSKKPILLTEGGELLIKQFESIVSAAQKVHHLVESSKTQEVSGTINVGVIPTVAPYLLPRLLRQIANRYPKVTLNIFEFQTERILEAIDSDEVDVGILALPVNQASMIERNIYFEPFSLLCRKDHEFAKLKKIKHAQIKAQEIWLLQEGHCLRNQVLDVCSLKTNKDHKRNFNFESGSLETLKNLVSVYGGYTLLPQMATELLDPKVIAVPIEKPIPAREIGLLYRREHYKLSLIDSLEVAIRNSAPSQLIKEPGKDVEILPVSSNS